MGEQGVTEIARTVAAVVFRWEGTAVRDRRSSAAQLARRVETLCAAGVHFAAMTSWPADEVIAQLGVRPRGPGRLMVTAPHGTELLEVLPDGFRPADRHRATPAWSGEHRTEPVTPLAAVLAALAEDGIGPGLVLVVDGPDRIDEHRVVPSLGRAPVVAADAPADLRRLLDEQVRRRRNRRVPAVDEDPAWVVRISAADNLRRGVAEALLTLGAGGFATRGIAEEASPDGHPAVLATGVYTASGAEQHLLPGPSWTQLVIDPPPVDDFRILDLRTGVLVREEALSDEPPFRSLRFASLTRLGVMALRAEGAAGRLGLGRPREQPHPDDHGYDTTVGRCGDALWTTTGDERGPRIAAMARRSGARTADLRTVERMAAFSANPDGPVAPTAPQAALAEATEVGFDRLLTEHRSAWAARWGGANVRIPDDPAAELAIRYVLFQLWCNTARLPELAVGARGLSGPAYRGHVFWDADVFVLPALATMDPAAAGGIVGYRRRRLAMAQARARGLGYAGARFPWESAATGEEVTPSYGSVGVQRVPILTGELEEHITADVAWAAVRAAEWSGVAQSPAWDGFELLVETARYWASRCRRDAEGLAHIDGVIGPDEYHESVDDNAFTNVMARWNLRRAARVAAEVDGLAAERHEWCELADRLVDGFDAATKRYEQFAGYFGLEPLVMADVAGVPTAADAVLGRDRVSGSQLIKQPDVLMLHHMVPDEVAAGSLTPNIDFYAPRTSHGSTLSPSVSASVLARAGRPDAALAMLDLAMALDLKDASGSTSDGLHIANLGGIWQAVLTGFAGVRVTGSTVHVDPSLPARWPRLDVRFRAVGARLALRLTRETVEVAADSPVLVSVAGGPSRLVANRSTFPTR